ncbi:response regulator [Robiginitalea sp. M366]|uniref:response regulator n=1 Tax=Robiginitalea aestuariiviva TaxID=3036903 RepID=UPI00240D5115|nr:response regulator [Robiginitalea aestuariiviva]MDG1572944.1 response regulator [Robiginitalea aestuariiviva]
MPTQSKNLQGRVLELKDALHAYSFESLSVEEAQSLKQAFDAFCTQLDDRYWNPEAPRKAIPEAPQDPADQHPMESFVRMLQPSLEKISGAAGGLLSGPVKPDQQEALSAIDRMSRSMLELLARLQNSSKAGDPGDNQTPAKPEDALKGKNILVFEDNELNMRLMDIRLKTWGCRVLQASHATLGLAMLQAEQVDAVLMDLRMPDMDGYQACSRIRKHLNPALRKLPVIAVTADMNAEYDAEYQQAGFDAVIVKPFAPEELSGKLLELLAGQPATKDEPQVVSRPGTTLDLQTLVDECDGDVDMLEELAELFKGNILEFLGRLKVHSATSDFLQIREAAHKVKAGLMLLGASHWIEAVSEIQQLSRAETGISRIIEIYTELTEAYPVLESSLHAAMAALKKQHGQ